MRLYLTHSSGYDYKNELYTPIKRLLTTEHTIIFPHDDSKEGVNSKDIIPQCDAVLAEVSYPSTGQGIEIGWADASGIPVICFYQSDRIAPSALRFINCRIIIYENQNEMIKKLDVEIKELLDSH